MPYADFRDHLLNGLGGEWPDSGPLNPIQTNCVQKDGYRIEELSYEAEPDDRIPALLLIPDHISAPRPAPGICVWHQHAGQ